MGDGIALLREGRADAAVNAYYGADVEMVLATLRLSSFMVALFGVGIFFSGPTLEARLLTLFMAVSGSILSQMHVTEAEATVPHGLSEKQVSSMKKTLMGSCAFAFEGLVSLACGVPYGNTVDASVGEVHFFVLRLVCLVETAYGFALLVSASRSNDSVRELHERMGVLCGVNNLTPAGKVMIRYNLTRLGMALVSAHVLLLVQHSHAAFVLAVLGQFGVALFARITSRKAKRAVL